MEISIKFTRLSPFDALATLKPIELFTFYTVVLVCLGCGLVWVPHLPTSTVELPFSMNGPSKAHKPHLQFINKLDD